MSTDPYQTGLATTTGVVIKLATNVSMVTIGGWVCDAAWNKP